MPAKSRDQIVNLLKQEGPQDAGLLAARVGVSAMAVRQHLYELQDEGLVSAEERKGSVGRPVKVWGLTEASEKLFPDGHGDFTYELIQSIRETFGEDGMDALLKKRSQKQIEEYRALMGEGNLASRLERLAERRSEEGYMAEVKKEGDDLFFIENHCPVCRAARACSGLCAEELCVLETVLGPDVSVERVDHIVAGARRCAYRVSIRSLNG